MANPARQVSGEYIETCSCDYVCACICGTGLFQGSVASGVREERCPSLAGYVSGPAATRAAPAAAAWIEPLLLPHIVSGAATGREGCLYYDAVPMLPIWINEDGKPAQTRPCPRPGCGRPYPVRRYRYETLRQIGWPLFRVARYVEWCGHGQELIPVPDEGEWVRLVPVIGTAK